HKLGVAPTQPTPTTKPPATTPTTPKPTTTTTTNPAPATRPTTASPPPPANTVSPPSSIDRTGVRDVTAELQTFLNSVSHHTTVKFAAGAQYRIEGTLTMGGLNDV